MIKNLRIVTRGRGILGDILAHDAPGPDGHVVVNHDVLDDADAGADIDVVTNLRRATLIRPDGHELREIHVVSDNRSGVEHDRPVMPYVQAVADLGLSPGFGCVTISPSLKCLR